MLFREENAVFLWFRGLCIAGFMIILVQEQSIFAEKSISRSVFFVKFVPARFFGLKKSGFFIYCSFLLVGKSIVNIRIV